MLEKVKSAKTLTDCTKLLYEWLTFFRLGHIGIELIQTEQNFSQTATPLKQFAKSQEKKKTDEVYTILKFSRVCFDDKKENGVIVIDYQRGYESGSMSGYHGVLLIKKQNGKWVHIPRK